jgi:hypothetical protein
VPSLFFADDGKTAPLACAGAGAKEDEDGSSDVPAEVALAFALAIAIAAAPSFFSLCDCRFFGVSTRSKSAREVVFAGFCGLDIRGTAGGG